MKRVLFARDIVQNRAFLVPMTAQCVRLTLLTLMVGLWSALPAEAINIMTPAGLNPGDQFRIIFVTDGGRNATSSNIADYDAFVDNTAAGLTYNGADVTWFALGSTPTVAANSSGRLPVDANSPPLFRLDGVKVADNTADLWDGTIDAPINVTEAGLPESRIVWTGTAYFGNALTPTELGAPVNVTVGGSTLTTSDWVQSVGLPPHLSYSLYGYSEILTVIPEPTSLTLLLTGIAGLVGRPVARWRRGDVHRGVARNNFRVIRATRRQENVG